MITLAWRTPPEWAVRAAARPLELLSDHAHCELRAASAAQSLITKNPSCSSLVDRLGAVALEELRHFRRVLRVLRGRGGELGPAMSNPYVDGLHARSHPTRGSVLLDRLLVAAVVEGRSHERFSLLAEASIAPDLGALYGRLLISEAAHAGLFVDLAGGCFPSDLVERRLGELLELEAQLLEELPFEARVHSGMC